MKHTLPQPADIEKLAAHKPHLINALVAYFVLEWQQITVTDPMHGLDQMGDSCLVPDYVGMWGLDECLNALKHAPTHRDRTEPGAITRWLDAAT